MSVPGLRNVVGGVSVELDAEDRIGPIYRVTERTRRCEDAAPAARVDHLMTYLGATD
jgi:hypothetical protein